MGAIQQQSFEADFNLAKQNFEALEREFSEAPEIMTDWQTKEELDENVVGDLCRCATIFEVANSMDAVRWHIHQANMDNSQWASQKKKDRWIDVAFSVHSEISDIWLLGGVDSIFKLRDEFYSPTDTGYCSAGTKMSEMPIRGLRQYRTNLLDSMRNAIDSCRNFFDGERRYRQHHFMLDEFYSHENPKYVTTVGNSFYSSSKKRKSVWENFNFIAMVDAWTLSTKDFKELPVAVRSLYGHLGQKKDSSAREHNTTHQHAPTVNIQ